MPTLSSMQEPLVPARIRQAKEKTNNDSKAEERGKCTGNENGSRELQSFQFLLTFLFCVDLFAC